MRLGPAIFGLILLLSVASHARPPGEADTTARFYSFGSSTNASSDTIIDPAVDWPVLQGIQQSEELTASFDCFGGISDRGLYRVFPSEVEGWPAPGFIAPRGSGIDYTYLGTVQIGGVINGDSVFSAGVTYRQNGREILPPGWKNNSSPGSIRRIKSPGGYGMHALYTDTLHDWWDPDPYRDSMRLNVRMVLRSHVWRESHLDHILMYDLVITNIGDQLIDEGYLGLWYDCDIGRLDPFSGEARDDMVGSVQQHGIIYAIDGTGDPILGDLPDTLSPRRAFAVKFNHTSVSHPKQNFNWMTNPYYLASEGFAPRMRSTDEYPLRWFRRNADSNLVIPEDDADWYYLLAKPEWDYAQVYTKLIESSDDTWLYPSQISATDIADGADIYMQTSIGPFDLPPDSSVRIIFSNFAPDSVIKRPDMHDIIRFFPEYWSQTLGLNRVIESGRIADSLALLLADPMNPPTGLYTPYNLEDSLLLEWDPWVFDDIEGYDIFVTPVPNNALRHPGVVEPWFRPVAPQLSLSVDHQWQTWLASPGSDNFYCLQVAHRTPTGRSELSDPEIVRFGPRPPAPQPESEYVFSIDNGPAELRWSPPAGTTVDHYNIYRFPDEIAAKKAYHAFYDKGASMTTGIDPVEQFQIGTTTWYYYAMQPAGIAAAHDRSWVDPNPVSGDYYVISAVDSSGYEGAFSQPVRVETIPPRTRDILVLTHSSTVENFVSKDTLKNFYNELLAGCDFDVFYVRDSLTVIACPSQSFDCLDWHEFARYKLIIVDDGLQDRAISEVWQSETAGLTKYLASGGKVAWFGAFTDFQTFGFDTPAGFHQTKLTAIKRFFGVDSIFYAGLAHFLLNDAPPYTDTLFGFRRAEPLYSHVPALDCDSTRDPFSPDLSVFWPDGTPPVVGAFVSDGTAEPTHRYRSRSPSSSIVENTVVGLHKQTSVFETWTFGFHLWYMNPDDARALIDWFGIGISDPACCIGMTGNVDGSISELPDVGDVVALVDYLFGSLHPPACRSEANVDSDPNGVIDIGDLALLVDHLFLNHAPLAECPASDVY